MSALPGPAEVEVSIIIPAWRLTDELQDCLDALAAQVNAPTLEVIVVVNGGDKAVSQVARDHPLHPTVRDLPVNIGFGRACNLGASTACGEYLVFLNDDTQVEPNWLAAAKAAGEQPGVGAVVPLLLEMDGETVMEAGARIVGEAEYHPFGIGQTIAEAAEAGVLAPRNVDYGSGAAILISADLFRKLGGFDPIFAPAYYEDTDLQFRIRAAGYTIWFEPTARVRHHANRSTKDLYAFREFASERSRALFLTRWRDVLADAPSLTASAMELTPMPDQMQFPPGEHNLLDGAADPALLHSLVTATNAEYVPWLENIYIPRLYDQIGDEQQKLRDVQATLSWRITKPLRAIRALQPSHKAARNN